MICKPLSFKLSFLGKKLLPTDSVKDLGVIFDPTLTFDYHISALSVSCISKLAQINCAKHAFNSDLLVILINVLFCCKLFYCPATAGRTLLPEIRVNCNT